MSDITVFRAAAADQEQEPWPFDIEFVDKTGRVVRESFEVERPLPVVSIVMHSLLEAELGIEDPRVAVSLGELIRDLLGDEQVSRFRDATTRARFDVPDLIQVVAGIIEGASGRPTGPSSGSASSESRSGGPSSDGASQRSADPFSGTSTTSAAASTPG